MAEKTALSVSSFGGINKLHTRELGQASEGKNFWTRNGALRTREGSSLLPSVPFTSSIRSVHQATKAQIAPRLLVEEESKLWRYNGSGWQQLLSGVSGSGFSSVMYYDHLILVNGLQKYAYDVAGDTIAPLQNLDSGGGGVPDMEFITAHKGILFGWGPHFADSCDVVWYNGYLKDADGKILEISKDVWPADHYLEISTDEGTSVYACVPSGTHLLVLTNYSYYLVYGDRHENFSVTPGGAVGVYSPYCVAKVGDYTMWLSLDEFGVKRVYAYSGTQPYVISQQVEEFLNDLPKAAFAYAKAYGFGTKFWLILPDTQANTTRAFIFDTEEKQWYIHEYPAAFNCACLYDGNVHFGTNDARIVKLDDSPTDFGNPITTEFKIGPVHIEDARKFKLKRLWINAEPRNDFTLDVYTSSDAGDEAGPYTVTFTAGGQKTQFVKPRAGHKGKDVYLRVVTQDRINELQSFSLTILPKSLK